MPTKFRNPVLDEQHIGGWTQGPTGRFAFVDDYPDTAGADFLTCTALGTLPEGGTAARASYHIQDVPVPPVAVISEVKVTFTCRKASSTTAAITAVIKVGGTYYPSTINNPSTTFTTAQKIWVNNPKTGAAWTIDEVNGDDPTNSLEAFGVQITDTTPNISVAAVRMEITYTANYSVTYDRGQFTHTGRDVVLTPPGIFGNVSWLEIGNNYKLTAETGSFALTGQKIYTGLFARPASFTYTLNNVDFSSVNASLSWLEIEPTLNKLDIGAGTFTLGSGTTNFRTLPILTAERGSIVFNGQFVELSETFTGHISWLEITPDAALTASQGTFTFSGSNVAFEGGFSSQISWLEIEPNILVDDPGIFAEGASFILTVWPSESDFEVDADIPPNFVLTGNPISLLRKYTLAAERGLFNLVSPDTLLTGPGNTNAPAATGSFSLSSATTNLLKTVRMSIEKGAFTVTTFPATLSTSPHLDIGSGQFILDGKAATFGTNHIIFAQVSGFSFTGVDVNFTRPKKQIEAITGSFIGTYNDAGLIHFDGVYELTTTPGVFSLSSSAGNTFDRGMPAAVGTFTQTGIAVTFPYNRVLSASSGRYFTTGQIFGPMVQGRALFIGIGMGIGN